jgi:hypothetical protein
MRLCFFNVFSYIVNNNSSQTVNIFIFYVCFRSLKTWTQYIFVFNRKLRCPRNFVHINLFFAFVARTILVMIVDLINKASPKSMSASSISSTANADPNTKSYVCFLVFS